MIRVTAGHFVGICYSQNFGFIDSEKSFYTNLTRVKIFKIGLRKTTTACAITVLRQFTRSLYALNGYIYIYID